MFVPPEVFEKLTKGFQTPQSADKSEPLAGFAPDKPDGFILYETDDNTVATIAGALMFSIAVLANSNNLLSAVRMDADARRAIRAMLRTVPSTPDGLTRACYEAAERIGTLYNPLVSELNKRDVPCSTKD